MTKYRTIVADPPWPSPFGAFGVTHPANPDAHYRPMGLDEIASLPVGAYVEDQAHLYLWVLNRNVADGWRIAQAWGFRVLTMLTWCKPGPGVGHWFRNNTEHVLFATRGAPMAVAACPLTTWFAWPRGAHSAKPEAFTDLVETVSPGPYLELFARRNRLGWDTWGNECLQHMEFGA